MLLESWYYYQEFSFHSAFPRAKKTLKKSILAGQISLHCTIIAYCLKLNIQKTKTMASSPITSWQIDGETVADFIFLGSKTTADVIAAMKLKDACCLEEKLWPT